MRILLLTSEYPPYSWGDLGRYSYEVYNEMKTRFDVDVLNIPSYYLGSSNKNEEFETGIRVDSNQSCAGAPRCKQRGMFAPPLWL